MADYKIVQKLDEKLISEGVLDSAYKDDYRKVHSKLNSDYKKSGAVLPAKIFAKNEARLRKWLGELYKKGASQERLTSYLRCGLAHLSLAISLNLHINQLIKKICLQELCFPLKTANLIKHIIKLQTLLSW